VEDLARGEVLVIGLVIEPAAGIPLGLGLRGVQEAEGPELTAAVSAAEKTALPQIW
jgi:hypothetical protein